MRVGSDGRGHGHGDVGLLSAYWWWGLICGIGYACGQVVKEREGGTMGIDKSYSEAWIRHACYDRITDFLLLLRVGRCTAFLSFLICIDSFSNHHILYIYIKSNFLDLFRT